MARGKKVNTKAKIKDINLNDALPVSIDEQVAELEEKIGKMKEDRDSKCKAAKEQLVEMIEVTRDKYYTATGVAEALRIIRFVKGENQGSDVDIAMARNLACDMAGQCALMADKARDLEYWDMDQLCDGFYDTTFAKGFDSLSYEMMRIDLCRNVGGAAEDMVEFWNHVQEEIDATTKALMELSESKEDTEESDR